MKITRLSLSGLLMIEPDLHADDRGSLVEAYHAGRYAAAGLDRPLVQQNLSCSHGGVLRGLHIQHPNDQAKLVTVIDGEIFDVAIDLRRGSPSFGRWESACLSADNRRQLWIPEGFAHGFCVTGEIAVVAYNLSAHYDPANELTITWDDPDLAIPWPVEAPILSDRDWSGIRLSDVDPERLPECLAIAS